MKSESEDGIGGPVRIDCGVSIGANKADWWPMFLLVTVLQERHPRSSYGNGEAGDAVTGVGIMVAVMTVW